MHFFARVRPAQPWICGSKWGSGHRCEIVGVVLWGCLGVRSKPAVIASCPGMIARTMAPQMNTEDTEQNTKVVAYWSGNLRRNLQRLTSSETTSQHLSGTCSDLFTGSKQDCYCQLSERATYLSPQHVHIRNNRPFNVSARIKTVCCVVLLFLTEPPRCMSFLAAQPRMAVTCHSWSCASDGIIDVLQARFTFFCKERVM